MKLTADYHTHTQYSHGKGSIRDNVLSARKKGIYKLGISDHGPAGFLVGISSSRILKEMKAELCCLNEEFPDMNLYLGLEANLIGLDGSLDVSRNCLKYLDFLIIGLHLNVIAKSCSDFRWIVLQNYLEKTFKNWKAVNKNSSKNTDMFIRAMDRYQVNFISHPGLHVNIDTKRLARACSHRNVKLEINCNHISEMTEFIAAAISYSPNVKFVISSDAHEPEQVGEVKEGIELCRKLNLPKSSIVNLE